MSRVLTVTAVTLGMSLAGCTMIPKYDRPAPPISSIWPRGAGYNVSGADEAPLTLTWRNFYRDQVLQDLIQLALENNRDLRIAQAQVEAASSQVDIQNASLFPTFSGTAAATISQENSRTVGITDPSAPIFPRSYGLGLGVSAYEIDLWGRVRSASAAAFQRYMDSALTRESIRISLMSNVAAALLTWVADNQAVAVTEQVLQNWQHTYDLVHATAVMGTGNDLDVAQAESTVDEAKRDLQTYLRQRAQAYNQLQLLVGSKIPDQLETSLKQKTNLTDIMSFPTVPAGLPSELVGRRPDIMGAEASLRAANADIGAARAAFYPRIQLTASDGSASSDITKLFSGGMGAWNIAPSITLPFFDAGRLTAELKGAKARKRQQIAEYEKSVQVAFREVADALAGRGTYLQELEAQDALVRANSRQYELALARFQAGSNDYLDTLVAQRALYAARLGSITTELQRRSNEITLFKALGGGWGGETEKRSWSLGEHLL